MATVPTRELFVKLGVEADTDALLKFNEALKPVVTQLRAAARAAKAMAKGMAGVAVSTEAATEQLTKSAQGTAAVVEGYDAVSDAANRGKKSTKGLDSALKRQAKSVDKASKATKKAKEQNKGLNLGLLKLDATLGITEKLMKVTAFAARGLFDATIGLALSTAEYGDRASKAAQRTAVTAEEYQELSFAASRGSVTVEQLEIALKTQARTASEAARGTGEAKDTYARLKVKIKDANGVLKPQIQLLNEVADALPRLNTDMERAEALQRIYGESGSALLPILKDGSAGLNGLRQEARDLGIVMSEKATEASVAFTDSITNTKAVLTGLRSEIGGGMIPTLTRLMGGFRDFISINRNFIRQRIDRFMKRVEKVVNVLRLAFIRADKVVDERLGGWPVLFEQIEKIGKFLALSAGLVGITKLAVAARVAMLALWASGGPVTLGVLALTAGVVALALALDDLVVFAQGGKSAIGQFLDAMDPALAKEFRASLNELGFAVDDLAAVFDEAFSSIGLDAVSLSKILKATIGGPLLLEIKRLKVTVDALRIGFLLVPKTIDAIADSVANALEKVALFLGAIDKFSGLRERIESLVAGRRAFAAEGGAFGIVEEQQASRERGRNVMAFRASGGVAAVAADTARQQRAQFASPLLVSQPVDVKIEISGADDPRAVSEEVKRVLIDINRQAMDGISGVPL